MGLKIIRSDITEMSVDAIVNTTNLRPVHGTGTDSAIYKKAGPKLLAARRSVGIIPRGDAAITQGYQLPSKYVIHTVATHWIDGSHGEIDTLTRCYQSALSCALNYNCKTLAFPLIGTGNYHFPKKIALKIAINECVDFLINHSAFDLTIYLVMFDPQSVLLAQSIVGTFPHALDEYDFQNKVFTEYPSYFASQLCYSGGSISASHDGSGNSPHFSLKEILQRERSMPQPQENVSLKTALDFFMDARGINAPQLYNAIGMHRQTFSQIYNDGKTPKKSTLCKIALGLHLDYEEAKYLLSQAGYALNKNDPTDEIMIICFRHHIYDFTEIDCVLYDEVGKTYFSDIN